MDSHVKSRTYRNEVLRLPTNFSNSFATFIECFQSTSIWKYVRLYPYATVTPDNALPDVPRRRELRWTVYTLLWCVVILTSCAILHRFTIIIADAILNSSLSTPLNGVAIGNGWIDPRRQYPSFLDYAVKHGIVELNSDVFALTYIILAASLNYLCRPTTRPRKLLTNASVY